jgi:predicted nucleotidyltransferase
MTNTLSRSLEIKHDRIDPLVLEVVKTIDEIAKRNGTKYFIAGATAREIILRHVFGRPSGRRTLDVDLGIAVQDWREFQALKNKLIQAGFSPAPKHIQRVIYPADHPVIVDLIPFGGIENKDQAIAWPPDEDIVMQVAGFNDALESAILVKLDNSLTVPVVSIPLLIVLKLFAWMDRRMENTKDAEDIFTILKQYADAGNEDRLYGEHLALLQQEEFDMEMAGARLAAIDCAAASISDQTRSRVINILNSSVDVDHLTRQIITVAGGLEQERAKRCELMIKKFRDEFLSRVLRNHEPG